MVFPEHESINTVYLQRLFDSMSECYKLFWFQAVCEAVFEGKQTVSFDYLVNKMIVNAWYMVSEYKLNLGPADTLEALVHYTFSISGLKSSEKKENLTNAIASLDDKEFQRKKLVLTYNVPYRLQAPFLDMKGDAWNKPKKDLASNINSSPGVIYHFGEINGLNSEIIIDKEWADYISSNYEILTGWARYNMIMYLQRRNPSVPGIASKLEPPQERKLEKVKNYWKALTTVMPVYDIYGKVLMSENDLSIDHFVPWSYVAHDELWNLNPTTKSINSKKSNSLPDWDEYYLKLSALEFAAYQATWKYDKIHDCFDKCLKDHVNNVEIQHKLYRKGLSFEEFDFNLKDTILPIYNAAKNLGFERWILR